MEVLFKNKTYTFINRVLKYSVDTLGGKYAVDESAVNLYGADTESVLLPSGKYVPICFTFSSEDTGDSLRYFEDNQDYLFEFLKYYIDYHMERDLINKSCFIYFHNIIYDLGQLFKKRMDLVELLKTGQGLEHEYLLYEYDSKKIVLQKNGLFAGTAPFFTIKIIVSKHDYVKINFRDTFSFFPSSLKRICKNLGLETQKEERADELGILDYRTLSETDERKIYFEHYAKIDSRATRLTAEKIRELHISVNMKRLRVSSPAYAINYLLHNMDESAVIRTGTFDIEIMQIIIDSYRGGRTGGIYHGKVNDITVVDFHSSYPASMVTLPSFNEQMQYITVPAEDLKKIKPAELMDIINNYHCFMIIDGIEKDYKYPSIVTNGDNMLLPVAGKFEKITTTGVEVCTGLKSGTIEITKIHDLILLLDEPRAYLPFKEYAESAYMRKANAEKDSTEYISAKLVLNGGYGKLIETRKEAFIYGELANYSLPYIEGMENEFAKMYYESYVKSVADSVSIAGYVKETITEIIENFSEDDLQYTSIDNLSLTNKEFGRYAVPAAAALITATSRARLTALIKCTNAIYWDTDSAFIENYQDSETLQKQLTKGGEFLPDFIQGLEVGEELGTLGIEIQNAGGYLAGTKRYYLSNAAGEVKSALHGIPTAPYDEAEKILKALATGKNFSYTGRARPQTAKDSKTNDEIGKFTAGNFTSLFHLDNRLQWKTENGAYIGTVKNYDDITEKK